MCTVVFLIFGEGAKFHSAYLANTHSANYSKIYIILCIQQKLTFSFRLIGEAEQFHSLYSLKADSFSSQSVKALKQILEFYFYNSLMHPFKEHHFKKRTLGEEFDPKSTRNKLFYCSRLKQIVPVHSENLWNDL